MKRTPDCRVEVSSNKTRRLQHKLVTWYRQNQRELPWRSTNDPYAVWVSEIMLQQTQVQSVIPYYQRFLLAFPDIEHLAKADPESVLRAWAGLGYYSRARNLQRAAQEISRERAGLFPETYEEILALPGVGPYTAGAILSIAFGQPYPVLDGNVVRVLTRVFRIGGDVSTGARRKLLWDLARRLLLTTDPGCFNQGLMELGAIVCSPKRPRCLICPWRRECVASRHGVQEAFPETRGPAKTEKVDWAVAVIRHRGRLLIAKRARAGLLQGLWEFPGGEFRELENLKNAITRRVFEDFGLRIQIVRPLMTLKHSITRRRITLHAFLAKLSDSALTRVDGRTTRWVPLSQLDRYPFASASQRIIRSLQLDFNTRKCDRTECEEHHSDGPLVKPYHSY